MTAAITAAVALVLAGLWLLLRHVLHAEQLGRVLSAEDYDEAAAALAAPGPHPIGSAACGCRWQYLPGGHMRIDTCDTHAFICTGDGET